jgi:hypothetical protein
MRSVLKLSACISIVCTETVSIYMYIQVLGLYLNIQVLVTRILGIYTVCYTVSIKLSKHTSILKLYLARALLSRDDVGVQKFFLWIQGNVPVLHQTRPNL